MKADIKYTVRHHATPVKKIAYVLFYFAVILIVLLDLVWTPFKSLTPEMQALAVIYVLPKLYFDLHFIAILCGIIGFLLWLLRWRNGKIEITEDKLIINGSYNVSIWLRNMWEVDVRDYNYNRWRIRIDSKTDAIQIKFKTEREFEDFSEKLVKLVCHVENIRFKTMTD